MSTENVLVIGSGGREAALLWKLYQSPRINKLYCAPGNPGTKKFAQSVPLSPTNIPALLSFAIANFITLTVVGGEEPLFAGIVDAFQAAARIEESKKFAKELMIEQCIQTADYQSFHLYGDAYGYIKKSKGPWYVKASGPALGKGAIFCSTASEAIATLYQIMVAKKFNSAGETVLIEEVLEGEEISAHFIADRQSLVMFPLARDHKRALDGDKGENTGGMGTVAPVEVPNGVACQIEESALITHRALHHMGTPFRGTLFPGIMDTAEGTKVLEFNARFGDPETQVYMRLLDSDLLDLLEGSYDDTLGHVSVKWKSGSAVCVIMASGGYPGPYTKGFPITGISEAEKIPGVVVFQAGTAMKDEVLVTSGGRVLGVTSYAENIEKALFYAYEAVKCIHFEGMHYRKDIGASLLLQKV